MVPIHDDKFSSVVTSRLVSPKQWHHTAFVLWFWVPIQLRGSLVFVFLSIGWFWLGADTLRTALDYTGTVVFAFMGALCAIHRRKYLGFSGFLLAVICGFLTACGGGTLRTVLMRQSSVFWWSNPQYLGAVGLGTLAILWMRSRRALKGRQSWEIADHVALGIFVPLGVEHGLCYITDTSLPMLLIWGIGIGVLTGVGGGLMRDILLCRFPVAVCTPYAAVAVLGAAFHLYLYAGIEMERAWMLSGLIVASLANYWASWRVHMRHAGMERQTLIRHRLRIGKSFGRFWVYTKHTQRQAAPAARPTEA